MDNIKLHYKVLLCFSWLVVSCWHWCSQLVVFLLVDKEKERSKIRSSTKWVKSQINGGQTANEMAPSLANC